MTDDWRPPSTAELRVGMTSDQVRDLLGKPTREQVKDGSPDWLLWHYPDGVVVELRDQGTGPTVVQWAWRPARCPSCGEPFGAGVTRCWEKGCGFVIPASFGTVPFVPLPDGRTVLAHWTEAPKTPTRHGSGTTWSLTLEGAPFRYRDGATGEWADSFWYGTANPIFETLDRAPDGRIRVRYFTSVAGYQDWTQSGHVEVLLDLEALVAEWHASLTLDTDA